MVLYKDVGGDKVVLVNGYNILPKRRVDVYVVKGVESATEIVKMVKMWKFGTSCETFHIFAETLCSLRRWRQFRLNSGITVKFKLRYKCYTYVAYRIDCDDRQQK